MTTGQIQAPSSFELWWEKQRKSISTALTVVLVGVLGWYGYRLYDRIHTDDVWSGFAVKSGLQSAYVDPGPMASLLQNPSFMRQAPNLFGRYLSDLANGLVTKMPDSVERVDDKAFDEAIAAAKGTDREPLLVWLAANRAVELHSFERAEGLLRRLQTEWPDHFLCQQSDYPPQFRRDLKAPDPGAPPPTKEHKPELAEPVKGSVVALALAQIAEDKRFMEEQKRLYAAPEPDGDKTAIVKTDYGEFKIRFYRSAAPKHVETFLQLIENHHFDGMAIDQIHREASTPSPFQKPVQEFHFGLLATKEEQDRTKWDTERRELDKAEPKIDFEASGISHFPFMVAATAGQEGKSLPGRVWINASDASAQLDGTRVVFGRVVEGQEVVKRLVLDPLFSTEEERQQGSGSPRDTIRIQSITIQ